MDNPEAMEAGTRLGPYEVVALVGVGGMGEVYRARDTTLRREVALKVLPRDFAGDAGRLSRLQREAEVLASLNHPRIGSIYGLYDDGATKALVLELVEGPTLADLLAARPERSRSGPDAGSAGEAGAARRAGGRGLDLEIALRVAHQIAEAVEAAHEAGVIHRDLKPANVKVRPDGTVKVLDFGLAKVLDPHRGALWTRSGKAGEDEAPTLTAAPTLSGAIMGTPVYMSPEQARGEPLDRRTDIWAFGCLFFEMLAGRPPFRGDSVADTFARILDREPDWDALPADTPDAVRTLLGRCLDKSPQQRLPHIGAARLEIVDAMTGKAPKREARVAVRRRQPRRPFAAAAALAVIVIAVAGWLAFNDGSDEAAVPAPAVSALSIEPAPGEQWIIGPHDPDFAISPDGAWIAYTSQRADGHHLMVRPLNAFEGRSLGQIAGIRHPFFSPDGRWVGFVDGNLLKRVAVDGGPALPVATLPSYMTGATWGSDNVILFGTLGGGLFRVPSIGGDPLPVPTEAEGEGLSARWPEMLPEGRGVLFASVRQDGSGADIRVRSLGSDNANDEKVLVAGATFPRYAPTGHLLYVADGVLWAVRFDLERLDVVGEAAPIVPGVMIKGPRQSGLGAASIGIAGNGTLVYRPGATGGADASTLVWVDRTGREEPLPLAPAAYGHMNLSPDGSRIAIEITDASQMNTHVWVGDVGGPSLVQLTLDPGRHRYPVWTRDSGVIFQSTKDGGSFRWKSADGIGTDALLARTEGTPWFVTPDGRSLVYTRRIGDSFPLFGLSLDVAASMPEPLAAEPGALAALSPDGRWLAQMTAETGDFEVYVQPYPNPTGGRYKVTNGGGRDPLWSRDTGALELLYQHGTTTYAVAVTTEPSAPFGPSVALFDGPYEDGQGRYYDVAPDGRLLMIKPGWLRAAGDARLHVVLNWFEELRRLVP